ncbi:TRAP transporter substrate-binding protein [Desulfosporosinus burensis]
MKTKLTRFKIFSLLLILVMLLFTLGCGGSKKAETSQSKSSEQPKNEPIKLVLAHSATPDNSLAITYVKFADIVKQKSNGKLIIEIHDSGTLAGDQTAVDGVKMGTIDMGSSASNNMAGYTSAFLFADLPYVFNSIESSHKVWWGAIGDEVKQKVEKDINAKVLFFIDTGGGFRIITNNKKVVKTPDDLKNLKLRATASPIEIALLKAWGANPTPIAWPDVYTALEQKVVDGENLHPVWIYQAKHNEALKYMTEVNAMANVHVALISQKAWKKLTPELQKVILEASKEAQEYGAKVDAEQGQETFKKLVDAGLQPYKPSPEEAKKWRDIGMSIWPQFYDKVPRELIDRILDAQK